ncbi:MAG TPA: bile acid:sodium symporter [Verrucomicrobiales bacterium]|nr:bile acid:sodium symporter [Verrucomicrobiales bacterium]HRJ09083.1 bile acid:sodium symporter family protein [Prosthecobacter sp.]HRK14650.1 bile acid:sodium symporter family protein [Prosthecobacter sp.]
MTTGITLIVLFASLAVASGRVKWLAGLGFTFTVLAFGAAAFSFPAWFIAPGGFEMKQIIAPLVQLILLCMGMTLTLGDFARVLSMPRAVIAGAALQYSIMPLAGFAFARLFGLEKEVAAGLILIGSCPGGVSSNVITYLAKGNVPLSVTMTAFSTLLSPFITPFAMQWLAGAYVPVEVGPMMLSILKMIIAPLAIGFAIRRFVPRVADKLVRALPPLAMLSIAVIVAITVAISRDDLIEVGLILLAASACHNAAGYALGYGAARMLGLDTRDSRTMALEVGLQNGGMATGLAFNVLHSPAAALAAATFGPWSAITSSMLASWWRKK